MKNKKNRKRIIWMLIFLISTLTRLACQDGAASNPPSSDSDASVVPSGQLVFIEVDGGMQFVSKYDFETKTFDRFFTAPDNGWVSNIDVAPDNEQVMMAYAPPPPEGKIQFGYTSLFLTAQDNTAVPTLYLEKEHEAGTLFNPVWSPNGRFLYYSRIVPQNEDATTFDLYLERLEIESGNRQTVAPNGIWPRVSPNSEQITYVGADVVTFGNSLWIADADGSNAVELLPTSRFEVIDVPMFSPDGQWIYFTAVERETAVSFWHRLLGIKIASAHDIPSDWYRMPITGGTPEKLTDIREVGIYGDFSPDGQFLAFTSYSGLYLMQLDGTQLEKIADVGATTSLAWIE